MSNFDERALNDAWNEAYGGDEPSEPKHRRRLPRFGKKATRTRSVVIAAGILTLGVAPFAVAASTGDVRLGARNGTATKETEIISNNAATNALTGGYSTRQSNLSSSGGGAVYGCRSTVGGSTANPPRNPCVRANNLSTGYAFEFNATNGPSAGTITVGSGGDSKVPFTTNATGVAAGLNADRVDGANASDIVNAAVASAVAKVATGSPDVSGLKSRWVRVDATGQITGQSGGFSVISAYPTISGADSGKVYIATGSTVAGHGLSATVSGFSGGQTGAGTCAVSGSSCDNVNGTNDQTAVVSLRNADGTLPANANDHKAFYLTITE